MAASGTVTASSTRVKEEHAWGKASLPPVNSKFEAMASFPT
jgi:hypothetical protein